MEVDVECKTDVTEGMDRGSHTPEKSPAIVGHSTNGTDKKASPTSSNDMMETCNVVKAEKDVEADVRSQVSDKEKRKPDWEMVPAQKVEHMEENLEGSECPAVDCFLVRHPY